MTFIRLLTLLQLFLFSLFASEIHFSQEEKEFIAQKQIIKIGIESAKPYIYYNKETDDIDGLYADFLKTIIQKSGLQVKYIQKDWNTLLNNFKDKKLDLLPATFYSKSREKFGIYSDSYYNVKEYIYVRSADAKPYHDLDNKKVAVVKGYATIEKLKQRFQTIEIVETNNLKESINLVLKGDVDALVDYHLVVENFIYDNTIIGLKGIQQNFLDAISVHYLSHLNKPILHSILQKGLQSISKEEKEKIYRNWFSDIYTQTSNQLFTLKEKKFLEEHNKIRIRVRPDRPPFEFYKDGKIQGIAVDYMKKSADNVGINIEFILDDRPIKEAYHEMETTKESFDTLLFTVKNDEREKRFSFGEAYLSYPMMIIANKQTPYIGSMKDLKNKTIVLEKGFLTNKWIKRDYPSINIIHVDSTREALNIINDGDAYAYVGNLGITNYMISFEGLHNLKVAAPSGYGEVNYSFVAPKEWPELSSLLSKGYNQISASEHSAIQQKWFSIQTIDKTNYKIMGSILLILCIIIILILWWNMNITAERNKTKLALKALQKTKKELEHKKTEVEESQMFLQSVIDESPNPIIVKNYEGKFILVNQCVADLYQTDKASMLGKDDGDFIEDQEMAEFFRQNVREIMDKGETNIVYEDSQDVNTGEIRNFMSIKKPFKDINGEHCILVIANDITDIKKLEEEKAKNKEILFKQSKMAAMGEMIGNIAHQWRQPLSIISAASTGVLYLKEINQLSDEILINEMNQVNDNAQYLSRTIDDFRDFIKGERKEIEFILNDTIKSFINLVKGSIKSNDINVIENIQDNIHLLGYPNELVQCLINIFNNSKDALLNITDERYIFLDISQDENNVVIRLKDNAKGIPENILPHIFEPYFTTKHQSQGTGLGLSMTYNLIVDGMNGEVEASNITYMYEDKEYQGAEFIITLPSKS